MNWVGEQNPVCSIYVNARGIENELSICKFYKSMQKNLLLKSAPDEKDFH